MATTTTLNKSGLFSAFGLQLPFYFFKETTTHYLLLQIRHLSVAPCLPERIPIIATSYSPLQQELSVFFHFIIYFMCMDGSPTSTVEEQMEERTPTQAGRKLWAVTLHKLLRLNEMTHPGSWDTRRTSTPSQALLHRPPPSAPGKDESAR